MSVRSVIADEYLRELLAESRATRECLANAPFDRFGWKPHERSMELGYLTLLVADMPRWIQHMIDFAFIDLAKYSPVKSENSDELVKHFDDCIAEATRALKTVSDEDLKKTFELKNEDATLFSSPLDENISSTINHMVHHRGQLTVYLRLNDIDVPSIYGPSADQGGF